MTAKIPRERRRPDEDGRPDAGAPGRPNTHEVISVSLPRGLAERANALIPRSRRSRVIAALLARFLDAIERHRVAEAYAAYYARRPDRDVREEVDLLEEWRVADAEAWRIFDRETRGGRRQAR